MMPVLFPPRVPLKTDNLGQQTLSDTTPLIKSLQEPRGKIGVI